MNCPRCGIRRNHSIATTDTCYDPDHQEFFRRCRCVECGAVFYTIEYEVECDETLEKRFYAASRRNREIEAAKKQFNDRKAFKKRIRNDKRSQGK